MMSICSGSRAKPQCNGSLCMSGASQSENQIHIYCFKGVTRMQKQTKASFHWLLDILSSSVNWILDVSVKMK